MGTTIAGAFETRRDAEMAVERLVQEHKLSRTDIFIEPETAANSAGAAKDGADVESGHGGTKGNAKPALAGRIKVSVDLNDEAQSETVQAAFREFGAADVSRR